jgi:hypothetical protein
MMATLLIIDDDTSYCQLLVRLVSREGYRVLEANNMTSGLRLLEREEVQVVLSDVYMPDGNGVELTKAIKSKFPCIEVIVMTSLGRIVDGVNAIKNGAFDYLEKDSTSVHLIPQLSKAVEKSFLQERIQSLESSLSEKHNFSNIIGESVLLNKAKDLAAKVALTDASVLLLDQTGTGKEVFAQAIHYGSHRKLKPFIAVNCSSFGKEILESELFGHKAGAFTGALKDKRGHLDEAKGGTLFLDEIGDMDILLQAKLLRVLETKEYYRVGDAKPSCADVRIIAATNRNLEGESEKGIFRSDLFYRISGFQINLPSLNERENDIVLLSHFFIKELSARMNKPLPIAHKGFLEALRQHYWKGNIRELRNVIERALIISSGQLTIDDLPAEFSSERSTACICDLSRVEKQHIIKTLEYTKGNKAKAASLMSIGLTTLYAKLKEYQLS